jgi:hypothetical protein
MVRVAELSRPVSFLSAMDALELFCQCGCPKARPFYCFFVHLQGAFPSSIKFSSRMSKALRETCHPSGLKPDLLKD